MKVSRRMQKLLELLAYFRSMRVKRAANAEPGNAWDAASKEAHATLSNGDSTVTTNQYDFYANVISTVSHSTGKRAAMFVPVFADNSGEAIAGLVTAAFDPTDGSSSLDANEGRILADNSYPSGEPTVLLVDFDEGTAVMGDGETFDFENPIAFTPNTEYWLAASPYVAVLPGETSVTIPPFTYEDYLPW